jgi:hypothetical protein
VLINSLSCANPVSYLLTEFATLTMTVKNTWGEGQKLQAEKVTNIS